MAIQESGEMYLETIYVLSKTKATVRAIDISEHMGFSKPSVSRALGLLKEAELISVDPSGAIHLTEKGLDTANKIYERHTILTSFLMSLGVSEKTASDDACKIEHHISDESLAAIKGALNKTL
ncbi:MAG: metal-dependent transcriptional regulator [Clostridia bacterium]|nr:metal-dependent transcriptional regulator [Clostridia bacterium]MBO7250789.1 metal-dependent transcriptional regulator [Clostridia bacterium]